MTSQGAANHMNGRMHVMDVVHMMDVDRSRHRHLHNVRFWCFWCFLAVDKSNCQKLMLFRVQVDNSQEMLQIFCKHDKNASFVSLYPFCGKCTVICHTMLHHSTDLASWHPRWRRPPQNIPTLVPMAADAAVSFCHLNIPRDHSEDVTAPSLHQVRCFKL